MRLKLLHVSAASRRLLDVCAVRRMSAPSAGCLRRPQDVCAVRRMSAWKYLSNLRTNQPAADTRSLNGSSRSTGKQFCFECGSNFKILTPWQFTLTGSWGLSQLLQSNSVPLALRHSHLLPDPFGIILHQLFCCMTVYSLRNWWCCLKGRQKTRPVPLHSTNL